MITESTTNKVLNFKGKWRDYQKRVLDNLSFHLTDKKLHIVAAPGAGKTTLGIEVISRINKPTLIFAPTITIRNQWKQRIIEAFLEDKDSDIVSAKITEPKFITVITYQSLLASFCGIEEKEEEPEEYIDSETDNMETCKRFNEEKAKSVVNILKKNKINVFCFDEAHHLRNEWCKALNYLMETMSPEQTVSLTATPPYDADEKEWERYETLCGPIDEIISIPELVQNGDLCPHQDFVFFSTMKQNENTKINEQILKIEKFKTNLLNDKEFAQLSLKILNKFSEEDILNEPKLVFSFLSYLKFSKQELPKDILETLSVKENEIPKFNVEFQKIFLNYMFFKVKETLSSENDIKTLDSAIKMAKESGIILNKSVFWDDNPKMKKQIAMSIGKLDSIKEIVDLESNSLKKDLRMVILADYIKADIIDCSALGVIPIWQTLKDKKDISLAVLTGSIILLPENLKEKLNLFIKKYEMEEYISFQNYERDKNYLKITSKGTKKSTIVELITQMFNQGHITVMVGTQALLGEGWDAPSINSLVLSSTVSSYMLSNQMRGRAIRVDKNNPDKISNIWHLATIHIKNPLEIIKDTLNFGVDNTEEKDNIVQLYDYEQLQQRFQGFQAPSNENPVCIQNGIERIMPKEFVKLYKTNLYLLKENSFLNINNIMKKNASDRQRTKNLWVNGFILDYNNPHKSLRTGIESENIFETLNYNGGFLSILTAYTTIYFSILFTIYQSIGSLELLLLITVVYFCFLIKPTIKFLKCSSPSKILKQIGIVMLETLSYMGKIKTNLSMVDIRCNENLEDKSLFLSMGNLSPEENNLVIKCVKEFINPIENPRYIFVRKGNFFNITNTTDYHSIPSIIGQNKDNIIVFKKLWQKYIGNCEVIYTRNQAGRKFLLKARKYAYSSLYQKAKQLSRYE